MNVHIGVGQYYDDPLASEIGMTTYEFWGFKDLTETHQLIASTIVLSLAYIKCRLHLSSIEIHSPSQRVGMGAYFVCMDYGSCNTPLPFRDQFCDVLIPL